MHGALVLTSANGGAGRMEQLGGGKLCEGEGGGGCYGGDLNRVRFLIDVGGETVAAEGDKVEVVCFDLSLTGDGNLPHNTGNQKYEKYSDKLEVASNYGNDGDKNQAAALRNVPILDNVDLPLLIGLQGCKSSEAYQLLNNRWTAAIKAYENPSTYFAERPIMYSGCSACSASAWGQIRLPHQMVFPMAVFGHYGPEIDFIGELKQAMHNSNAQF